MYILYSTLYFLGELYFFGIYAEKLAGFVFSFRLELASYRIDIFIILPKFKKEKIRFTRRKARSCVIKKENLA